MKNKLFNIVKSTSETLGETAGQAIKGTAKGMYKGVTGYTDDNIAQRKEQRELSRRVNANSSRINYWAWLITVAAFCSVTFYFLGESKFEADNLIAIVSKKWPYYMAIVIAKFFVTIFSNQIAKEITN